MKLLALRYFISVYAPENLVNSYNSSKKYQEIFGSFQI